MGPLELALDRLPVLAPRASTSEPASIRPATAVTEEPPIAGLLITDLDNTLYDFPKYFEAGIVASAGVLSTELKVPVEELYAEFASVFAKRGGIEYPFVGSEIPSLASLALADANRLSLEAARQFWLHGRQSLHAYPTVADTLRHLALSGVVIVGWTDAPYREALRRLRYLGLDQYMRRLVAPAGAARGLAPQSAGLAKMPGYVRSRPSFAEKIPSEERKPNSRAIQRVLDDFRGQSTTAVVVGDSIERDLAPADGTGAIRLLAEYGARSADDHSVLMSVVPTVLPEVRRRRMRVMNDGDVLCIAQFAEVVEHFQIQQIMPVE